MKQFEVVVSHKSAELYPFRNVVPAGLEGFSSPIPVVAANAVGAARIAVREKNALLARTRAEINKSPSLSMDEKVPLLRQLHPVTAEDVVSVLLKLNRVAV